MSDERVEQALSDAIAGLAGTTRPAYLDEILEHTSRTRQRPWWTFAGRYRSMNPTLKFAAVASLALVIGIGVAPIIRPAQQAATPPPGATQGTGLATPFEGRWVAAAQLDSGDSVDGPPASLRGASFSHLMVDMSDPRMDGRIVATYNQDSYGDAGVEVFNSSFRIENDAGAWTERPGIQMRFPGDSPTAKTTTFVGSGHYEGLVAIAEIDWESFASGTFHIRGIIVDGDAPPVPETSTTE
jgi:hypothetical protein